MARPAARTLAAVAAGALAVGGAAAPAAASWSGSWSGPGAARATTLPAVGTVDAVCAGGASVAVSWAAAAPATAYEVWRSADLGPWSLVRAADPATTYTDTAAGPGERQRALARGGEPERVERPGVGRVSLARDLDARDLSLRRFPDRSPGTSLPSARGREVARHDHALDLARARRVPGEEGLGGLPAPAGPPSREQLPVTCC
jgi:hypothetical protein